MSRQFWADLLLGAVVAVLAIMFLSGSFTPNKDAQVVLADTSNQSMASVKSNIQTNAPAIVSASDVIAAVSTTCNTSNTTQIKVVISSTTHTFTTSTTASAVTPTGTLQPITTVCSDLSKYYSKVVSPGGSPITYTQQ